MGFSFITINDVISVVFVEYFNVIESLVNIVCSRHRYFNTAPTIVGF